MPMKQSKAEIAKKQKVVEDKTFGPKNKSKSKNVQKYVQSLQQNVVPKPDPSKLAAKKNKEEEKAREKELNDLFKIAVVQPKVPFGRFCFTTSNQIVVSYSYGLLYRVCYIIC
ncbi:hypothetical protein HanRHA438_Chr14g0636171 [Helianthus annuus]|uniref:Uncharacterized protein n=1 Tax=Helianthus annuus TaxID=4232 RepID=A0A251RSB9_HELAN|nr:zinc finger CCCH domain-containing protein 11 isoform X1 [Helianthus annuus]KAF5767596.1 hypothetical protein HanXRQr2_Chr14g0626201 [Helianthus annuus]KAJ0463115.1 hypothetical protein HanHA300_Chr14g0511581 [Helianthus annuus]KAJ0466940.1 hypothetical protein HanIR_Chr14g0677711 [Helianthus annuus]KAJ0484483.1 hypothetical protein HanHA89_Chr14g0544601 [Helianthus annuus]KAJ0655040.1 hypothetical protein HanLR1_Chr14g0513911 [Helianthus annuus]